MNRRIQAKNARAAPWGVPCGCCSICGGEVLRGEKGWYANGTSVCEDCFDIFARMELAPYETVFGMEERG